MTSRKKEIDLVSARLCGCAKCVPPLKKMMRMSQFLKDFSFEITNDLMKEYFQKSLETSIEPSTF